MAIRMEYDFPAPGDAMPLGDLVTFLQHAEAAGATTDTPVVAATTDLDDAIVVALRVELDGPTDGTTARAVVGLDRQDLVDAVALLEAVEDNDGDARAQLAELRDLRQRLTTLAMQ